MKNQTSIIHSWPLMPLDKTQQTNHKKLLHTIKELKDKVLVLEQMCRPQSHKRNQDDPDSGNPEGERRSKRLRRTTFPSSTAQQTTSTTRSSMQPTRCRSSDTQNVQESAAAIDSGETEKEEVRVSVTDTSGNDTGKSMGTEPTNMPTVEKPKAFSLSQSATRHVTDELYGKILMDARVRDVYDHELVRKTTTSPEQIINHPLLRLPEPTTY